MSLAGPPVAADMKGGRALVSEVVGTAPDGSKVRGRAIGVAGPSGVVAMLGLTTPAKFDTMRARVDSLAGSVAFFKPKRSPAMNILIGAWWHWHGTDTGYGGNTASSSYERTIILCTDGSFRDSDESNISVNERNYIQVLAVAEAGSRLVLEWFQDPAWANTQGLLPSNIDALKNVRRSIVSGTLYTGRYKDAGGLLFDKPYRPSSVNRFFGTAARGTTAIR